MLPVQSQAVEAGLDFRPVHPFVGSALAQHFGLMIRFDETEIPG
jgi:hypothetical protein